MFKFNLFIKRTDFKRILIEASWILVQTNQTSSSPFEIYAKSNGFIVGGLDFEAHQHFQKSPV